MSRIIFLFLSIVGVAHAGIWGLPRAYVVEDMKIADQDFIQVSLQEIALTHGLKDRLLWSKDLVTFAYYTGDQGTLQARKEGSCGIVSFIFLAKEKNAAESVGIAVEKVFIQHFGARFRGPEIKKKEPNQAPATVFTEQE